MKREDALSELEEQPPAEWDYDHYGYSMREAIERLACRHGGTEVVCGGRFFWFLNEELGSKVWREIMNGSPRIMMLLTNGKFLKVLPLRERADIGEGQARLYYESKPSTLLDYTGAL